MIKLVFFDVGGTLIRPYPSVGDIYSACAKRHGVNLTPSELEQKFKTAWKEAKTQSAFIDEAWWRAVVKRVFEGVSFKNFDVFFTDLYQTFDDPACWHIFPDGLNALSQLKEKGLRLAVASNWDSRLPQLLERLKLSGYFERQFISFEMGVAKPNPKFFKRALQEMGENSLEAIHVGDDPIEDVQCAEKAGLRTYLINRKTKPINSRMLVSLEELTMRI